MEHLRTGHPAPALHLLDQRGETFDLAEHPRRDDARTVVYFFAGAFTPGCTTQACDFRDSENSLRSAGYTVIGISPDKVERLEKFTVKENLNFPLASDPSKDVLKAYGAYGHKTNYGKLIQGVIRSTIVVDKEGRVSLAQYNVKAKGHVGRIRKALGID